MDTIFLFGAGASFGCGGTNNVVPLGSQLFNELRRFSPNWKSVPDSISVKFQNNFEEGMGYIWDYFSINIPTLMSDMAIFFANFTVVDTIRNLYSRLIQEIKKQNNIDRTIFSTLNYDCLIEISTFLNDLYISNFDLKQQHDTLTILKLHGSCNFKLKGLSVGGNIGFSRGIGYDSPNMEAMNINCVAKWCNSDNSLYPVMMIYTKNKPLQIGHQTLKKINDIWQEKVKSAKKVFIIGVHPNLEDSHIWEHLTKTKAKIYFCGDKEGFDHWQKTAERNDEFISTTFTNSIDKVLAFL